MENHGSMVREHGVSHAILMIIFSVLACITVSLRLWARRIQKISFTISDWLIVLGLVFALAEAGLNIYGCCFPEAWKTEVQSSPEYISFVVKLAFISPIVWAVAVTTIRVSVIFLYIHIFSTRVFRLICYGVLVFNMLFLASAILTECLICRPISYRWDYTIRGGSCGNMKAHDLALAIVNLLQDAIVVMLPMPVLWGLQMATGRKLIISCILGLGIAICAVTGYRVYISSTITTLQSPNNREIYALVALLASLEALLGIITACSPMLRPVAAAAWNALPKRSRDKMSDLTSAAGTILARATYHLSLPSMHSISYQWFSSRSESYERQTSVEDAGESVMAEKDEVCTMEKGRIRVRSDVEVSSIRSMVS